MKFCTKCKNAKPLDCFRQRMHYGTLRVSSICKACEAIYEKEYSVRRHALRRQKRAIAREKRKELDALTEKIPFKDRRAEYNSKYWQKRKTLKAAELKEKSRKYRESKKSDLDFLARRRAYWASEVGKANKRNWEKSQKEKRTNYYIASQLRKRLCVAIKNSEKSGSAVQALGCSIEEFRLYIESRFQPGMTWENWGRKGWHIDHIVPLSSFNLSDPEELKKACHFTNLQPLWAKDNLKKSNKILDLSPKS